MASGFVTAAGLDLDSVFAPQHSGWPQAAATGFFDGSGNDLNLRYAVLSTGTAAAATEFLLGSGADVNTVFAAYGSTNVQVAAQPSAISGSAAAGTPSGTVTSNTTSCAGTKGKGSYSYVWHIANGSGFTLTTPNSQTCAITGNIPASQSVSGAIYCTISDDVTSINTETVACSLQNTSSPADYFTMVAGGATNPSGGFTETGYSYGHWGSMSPQTFRDGVVFYALTETTAGSGIGMSVSTASNPGQGYVNYLSVQGVTYYGSDATYNFVNDTATWSWPERGAAQFVSGNTYSVQILRGGA